MKNLERLKSLKVGKKKENTPKENIRRLILGVYIIQITRTAH